MKKILFVAMLLVMTVAVKAQTITVHNSSAFDMQFDLGVTDGSTPCANPGFGTYQGAYVPALTYFDGTTTGTTSTTSMSISDAFWTSSHSWPASPTYFVWIVVYPLNNHCASSNPQVGACYGLPTSGSFYYICVIPNAPILINWTADAFQNITVEIS